MEVDQACYVAPDAEKVQALKDIANKIRIHSIESTSAANSGHPTSSCSAAEILSVLFFDTMRYKVEAPKDVTNDRLVLSKGHACPALYGAWVEAGLIPAEELKNLRKIDSDLEGHPTPRLSFIDVATGSLGQGLSVAAGMAYMGKYVDKSSYRVYCVNGDGETAEGSVWEALHFSSLYNLDNLTLLIDCNRLGQSGPTSLQHQLDVYQRRLEAFGWSVQVVDGSDVEALATALQRAKSISNQPTAIIAKTYKGAGIVGIENQDGFHGKPLGPKTEEALNSIRTRISNTGPHGLKPLSPTAVVPSVDLSIIALPEPPKYNVGDVVAPRVAYGSTLAKLGKVYDRVIALDGDMGNSTYSRKLYDVRKDQFIECYICEQNMVGVALGVSCRDRAVTFASTFGSFLSRAYDQIRMAAVSFSKINLVGTHCGVSIGPDGPSQMALEDLAMFRAIPGCTVFYPSDAVSMEWAVVLAANSQGMTFIRASRADAPVLYRNDEEFKIGQAKIVRKSDNDVITIVAAGVTLNNAREAAEQLATSGVHCRIIDPFTVKPIDAATITNNARQTGGNVLVVEDHYYEGGLGEAVKSACASFKDISVTHMAIGEVPRSGPGPALMKLFGIDSTAIVKAVQNAVSKSSNGGIHRS